MKNKMKVKIIMLPTDERVEIGGIYKRIKSIYDFSIYDFEPIGQIVVNQNPGVNQSNEYYTAQHLYIVNDDVIEFNDWFFNLSLDFSTTLYKPYQLLGDSEHAEYEKTKLNSDKNVWKKIIASTDTNLNLPTVPDEFIKEYVRVNGQLESILIDSIETMSEYEICKPAKESYTRAEVLVLLRELFYNTVTASGDSEDVDWENYLEHWISENL